MTAARSWLLAVLLLGLGLFAAYRIVAVTQADRWAIEDPARALQWMPHHPQALLTLAESQLADGRIDQAAATARRLLAAEPLEGRGFRVLAEAAAKRGDDTRALALYRIAARRSPRDLHTSAWLTRHHLLAGEYPAALAHIDVILRTSPTLRTTLLPLMVTMAADEVFAADLARVLQQRPQWRAGLLALLQRAEDPRAADAVMSALRADGGLSEAEFDQWIAYLLRQDRWGEAYGRWVGSIDLQGAALPLVYNGQFEQPVSGRGFDWRMARIPGVSVEFAPDGNASGLSAHATFRSRPVPRVNLEQPLLLAPGAYRFSARMRADGLRSDRGLEWHLACAGPAGSLASSERVEGTFGWRTVTMDVTVPVIGCQGQWLRLRNPAPSGTAQQVSGDLWFDDVAIARHPSQE